jgi:hypothetical protein
VRGGVVVNRSVCRFPQITSLRDFGKCRSNGESVGNAVKSMAQDGVVLM